MLNQADLLFPGIGASKEEFSSRIVEKIFIYTTQIKLNPLQTEVAEELIALAFSIGFPLDNLWLLLNDTSTLEPMALPLQETPNSLSLIEPSMSATFISTLDSQSLHSPSFSHILTYGSNNNNSTIPDHDSLNKSKSIPKSQESDEEKSSKTFTPKGEWFYITFKSQVSINVFSKPALLTPQKCLLDPPLFAQLSRVCSTDL